MTVVRVVLIAAALATWAGPAHTQSPPEAKALAQQAERRIRELQAEADRLAAQTSTLLGELRTLELEREMKGAEVKKADAELVTLGAALQQITARVQTLDAQRVADTPGVTERLTEIYKRGRGGYVRLLLAADDLRALGRLTRGVAAVARLDGVRFDAHRRTIRAEREALVELGARRQAVATAQVEATRARQALDAAVAAQNRRIDDLDRRRDLAARYVGELQDAQAALQTRVTTIGANGGVTLPLAPFRGALDWPAPGRVISRFGRSAAGRFGTAIVRNGLELAASEGQIVRAVHGGTVAFAAPFTGFATLVIVDHGDNAFTLYGHLEEALVAVGARVARGAVVGRAGRTPAGVPAIYFELRIDGRPVDPVQWLRSSR
ncbi:MAG TPA: peptidoglycan DD-metalloendopeptidase family protein [Vicinamibacterales bacterium]|nr:peptidoglycan DD-metalloendopeptidase family protein [Vicinamibacterales bacterium]